MSRKTRPGRPKPERLDEVPPELLRPAASAPPQPDAPTADVPTADVPTAGGIDPNDASTPGTPARARIEGQAERLRERGGAAFLYGTLASFFGDSADLFAYKLLLDALVGEMAPADPLERMLLDQAVVAHFALGRAQVRAANAQQADVAQIYFTAATKLMAEFRNSLLALKTYRTPTAGAGRGAVMPVPVPPSSGEKCSRELSGPPQRRTELGSNARRLRKVFRARHAAHA